MSFYRWPLIILVCFSCAKSNEEKVQSALNEAKAFMSEGQCSKARKVLDDVGTQARNPQYISLYASTYACQANYSELGFIENLTSLNSASILGSLAVLTHLTLSVLPTMI